MTVRPTRLLLYAATPDPTMLGQGFYAAEADGLRADPRVATVTATNRLADLWRADVDGIISYFYSHSAAAGAIARIRRIPVLATGGCEQLIHDATTSAKTYAARVAAFHACTVTLNAILATSTEDFERMRGVAVAGRDKIALSFHGVAAVGFASPRAFRGDREPGSLVTIAGLDSALNVRRKGVLRAVDLLARFRTRHPAAALTIIGRTTCREMVEAHAAAQGVADGVRFTGYVSEREKADLLGRSRCYVQLSDYEGFGIGALEALAHGCQVIHSNVGGLRDTIGDYGVVLDRDRIAGFDPDRLPPLSLPDWPAFQAHLGRFSVAHRADTLLTRLGLASPLSRHARPEARLPAVSTKGIT